MNEYVFRYKRRFLERRWHDRVYEVGEVVQVEKSFVGGRNKEEAIKKLSRDPGVEVFDIELIDVMDADDPQNPRKQILDALRRQREEDGE